MARYELGEVRRSQVIQRGPGAIIDFRAGEKGGGPVSVITSGLEFWEKSASILAPRRRDSNVVFEPRLQAKLKKTHFRQPPVKQETGQEDDQKYQPHIEGVRFPKWLLCPKCDRLAQQNFFDKDVGDPSRWCAKCTRASGMRTHVVPVRFVSACENGHISDFPWQAYFRRFSNQSSCGEKGCKLHLKMDGNSSALESLYLFCPVCRGRASLGNIFQTDLFRSLGFKCLGERPWLGDNEDCSAQPRTLQRGASNVYFPKIFSALSIPPWTNPLEEILDIDWADLQNMNKNQRDGILKLLAPSAQMAPEDLISTVDRRLDYISSQESGNLRQEEYLNFIEAPIDPDLAKRDNNFRLRKQNVPTSLQMFFETLVKVERIKEVKVQTGFSRIIPPQPSYDPDDEKSLSGKVLDWLPASVVLGEGIFFSLSGNQVDKWKENENVIHRTEQILQAFLERLDERGQLYEEQDIRITPEFILNHTLTHLLIQQMSLLSGYNSASIRERIFSGGDSPKMNGSLIFTGTSDSDGTLGGLARLAETDYFGKLIHEVVTEAQWCSSDPLCFDGIISTSESLNNAACHSCALLPETSCEYFNCFLDRAFVVGTPDQPDLGYFSPIIGNA